MKKLLIANRGEIAVRIARTAREMGIETLVVVSEADVGSLAARTADHAVVVGPAPAPASYLNQDADRHRGLGQRLRCGSPGLRIPVRECDFRPQGRRCGPDLGGAGRGRDRGDGQQVHGAGIRPKGGRPRAPRLGWPPRSGGRRRRSGPRHRLPARRQGLRRRRRPGHPICSRAKTSFWKSIEMARGEAASVFGDPTVYLERFVQHARHVEVQVLGDGTNFIHLGDRDCSMQRRSQKVIEEAPAPDLPDARPQDHPGILRGTCPRMRLQRRRNGRIPLRPGQP